MFFLQQLETNSSEGELDNQEININLMRANKRDRSENALSNTYSEYKKVCTYLHYIFLS